MQKLLNLARRIAPSISKTSASGVFYYIKNDTFLKNVYGALEAQEIIYLSFLIQGAKDGRDLEEVSQKCQKDLFSFSIVEVSREHPNSTCDNCGGDGSVSCDNCGSGKNECSECDGDGKESDEKTCSSCDGDGYQSCDYCDGDGYQSCDECNGSGDQEDTSEYNIEQKNFVSIDKNLFETLERMEEFTEIDESDFKDYVIQILSKFTTTDNITFEDEMGNTLFGEVSTTPALRKSRQGGIFDDSLFDIS